MIGKTLGQYHILEELGRGGMAVVYKAYQPALERYVAIKVLPRERTFDQEFVERFQREAKAAARLNHPNIVTIHDVGQADGTHFIVMEYVEGPSLTKLLQQQGALPLQRAAQIVSQVASALDYAHGQGFVHRDIKPGNILLGSEDTVKLTDFGIVKAAEGTRLTRTGTLLGTPAYMSPEQARGIEIGYRTDIYSLGVVAYEMLSGQVPFSGGTMAVLHAHAYDPPDLSVLPRNLQSVVGKALTKEPTQRYRSASSFAQALQQALAGVPAEAVEPPTRVRRRPRKAQRPSMPGWVWGLGAAAALLAVGVALTLAANGPTPVVSTPTRTSHVTDTSRPTHTPSRDVRATEEQPISTATPLPAPTEKPLTSPTPSPTVPSSATGTRITFVNGPVGNTDVCVMSGDGKNARCPVSWNCDEAEPAWAPNGTRIAYQCDCRDSYDIWIMDLASGRRKQLTDTPGVDEREPDWSPDGSQIIYRASTADGDRNVDGELWVMNSVGSDRSRLDNRTIWGRSPSWSPDGRRVLFMSERSGRWQIYVYDLSTSKTTRLTDCRTNCRWPCWSPDGRYVAYHSTVSASGSGSATAKTIWVIPATGGPATMLTSGDHPGRPSWSLGGQIVFNSSRGIETIAINGGNRQILLSSDKNWAPDWSK